MQTLLFASQNKNKLKEIRAALTGKYEVQSLVEMNFTQELDEPFSTFHENAQVKAKQGFDIFKMPCFAEDAGLVIEALHGRPGVFSARYAGSHKSDTDNLNKVLDEMKGRSNRKAYFIALLSYFDGQKHFNYEGIIYGHIAMEPRGMNGFGYDPIFIPLGYDHTFAELSDDIKKMISHRSQAVQQFVEKLMH